MGFRDPVRRDGGAPLVAQRAGQRITALILLSVPDWMMAGALPLAPQFSGLDNRAAAQFWRPLLRGEHPEAWPQLSVERVWGVLEVSTVAAFAEPVAIVLATGTLTEVLGHDLRLQPDMVRAGVMGDASPALPVSAKRSQAFRNHPLLRHLLKTAAG